MMTDPRAPAELLDLVRLALEEDVGPGDATTEWTVPEGRRGAADVVAKAEAVVAGLAAFECTFDLIDPAVDIEPHVPSGASVEPGQVVLSLSGPARALLTGERVALNFLGRLSGIATLTRAFVRAVAGTGARVVDTRKTTPGLRALEKYAVRVGGGHNHRFGLADGVLIKDNHIAIVGSIENAVAAVRANVSHLQKIEVEVDRIDQIPEALQAGADAILLDNMTPEQTREAVALVRSKPGGERILLESSGGVTLDTVRAYAEAGVDLISSGALTHSAPAVDISLDIDIS